MANYIDSATKHESVFRAILDHLHVPHAGFSIIELHTKYSEGDRDDKYTIINFYEKGDGIFVYSWQNMSILSGFGSSGSWKMVDRKAVHIGNEVTWMS